AVVPDLLAEVEPVLGALIQTLDCGRMAILLRHANPPFFTQRVAHRRCARHPCIVGSVRRAAEHAAPDRESPDHLRLEARGNPVHRRGPSAARANYRPFRWIT